MNKQHQVLLSVGTNLGNLADNVGLALEKIHQSVGSIIKVSALYETPSWGFCSNNFYNCVLLLHTYSSPIRVLSKILKIEKEMGRIRVETPGSAPELEKNYQSRIIDIDLIAFDCEIIAAPKLQLPHPRMHQRRFVLQPLIDVCPQWNHPILNKTALELLAQTRDSSLCTAIAPLVPPFAAIGFEGLSYIAFEGNIGAGKTTLATKIAEDFNAKTVLERFADNPFLPKFYEDQARYAFPLEMSFLADRYQQLSDDLAQYDLFKDFVVADYHIFKSLIFAKITLADEEFRLYRNLFKMVCKDLPKPDLYVYLYQNSDRLLQNIKKRGRSYEKKIPASYLDKINTGYLDYIKYQNNLNILIIDVSDRDFVKNQEDYLYILNEIKQKIAQKNILS